MKPLFIFISTLVFSVLGSSAHAAWAPANMGASLVVGDTSCASGGGKVVCAAQGRANAMVGAVFDGVRWSEWTSVAGGAIVSNPSCTSDESAIVCAARGSSGRLAATLFDGASFSALNSTGAPLVYSKPSCAMLSPGKFFCVARSGTGGLVGSTFNVAAPRWFGAASLATSAFSAPGCASDSDGKVICMFMNSLWRILAVRYDGASWSSELNMLRNINWKSLSPPTCSELAAPGRVLCFLHYRTPDSDNATVWSNEFEGGTWEVGNWSVDDLWTKRISVTPFDSSVACSPIGSRKAICAGMSKSDSSMVTLQYNAGVWSENGTPITPILSRPACATKATGVAVCTAIKVNNLGASATGP